MKIYDKITPEGTQDLLFESCTRRREVQNTIHALLEGRGFRPVMTPAMEFYDLFGGKRYFPQESMYKLVDRKGRLLVLRPDSTIPIARLVATRLQQEGDPIRLCYSQTAFRANPAMRGRMDELAQCGAELIGATGMKADLEILLTAGACFAALNARPFTLEIGHIGVFKALMEELDAPEEQKEQIRQLIEAKNYAALEDLLGRLPDTDAARALKRLPRLFGGASVLDEAAALSHRPQFLKPLEELRQIYLHLTRAAPQMQVTVDFGLIHQAEYYTGILFRGYLPGVGEPVLSGGRYDRLLLDFGIDKPAVGFALQLDAIGDYLWQRSPKRQPAPQVLVFWQTEQSAEAFSHIRALAKQNISCESSLHETLAQAIAYAKAKGIGQVHVMGDPIRRIDCKEEEKA